MYPPTIAACRRLAPVDLLPGLARGGFRLLKHFLGERPSSPRDPGRGPAGSRAVEGVDCGFASEMRPTEMPMRLLYPVQSCSECCPKITGPGRGIAVPDRA